VRHRFPISCPGALPAAAKQDTSWLSRFRAESGAARIADDQFDRQQLMNRLVEITVHNRQQELAKSSRPIFLQPLESPISVTGSSKKSLCGD